MADPDVEIPWSEVESGQWQAICVCGSLDVYEEPAGRLVRLDPLDPKTARHAPQCEFVGEKSPAALRVLLKVSERDDSIGSSAPRATSVGRFRTN